MFNFARYTFHDNNLCNCCLSPYFFRLKIKLTLFLSLKNTCMTLFTCKTIDLYVLVSSSRGVKAILLKKYLNWCHMCCKGGGLTLIGMSYESKKNTLLYRYLWAFFLSYSMSFTQGWTLNKTFNVIPSSQIKSPKNSEYQNPNFYFL